MSNNKLLNDLTDEELLKVAGEQYKETNTTNRIYRKDMLSEHNHDVLNFVIAFNFKEGKKKVSRKLLYNLYKSWSKDPVSKIEFSKQLHLYFSKHTKDLLYLNSDNRFLGSETYKRLAARKKSQSPLSSPFWQRHLDLFLNTHGIEAGNNYLEVVVIHHLYERWRYENNIKSRMGRRVLARVLAARFPVKTSGAKKRYYIGLNDAIFNHLTEESIKNVREAWYAKKQKKNKTI